MEFIKQQMMVMIGLNVSNNLPIGSDWQIATNSFDAYFYSILIS